jgi:hypothetical protein
VPKGEFLTSPQPGEPGFWVDFRPLFLGPEDPLFRPLESKKPKSPLFLGAFPPLGGRALPARTVFWAFFPKNGLLAGFRRLACKAGDRKGTNSSSERVDEVVGDQNRKKKTTTTEIYTYGTTLSLHAALPIFNQW